MANEKIINFVKLHDFEEFMNNTSDETKDFFNQMSHISRNQAAIAMSQKINTSEKRIKNVDRNHIPSENSIHITPKQCGADISKNATINKNKHRKYSASKLRAIIAALALSTATIGLSAVAHNKNENITNFGVTSETKSILNDIAQLIESNKLGIDNSSDIRQALDSVIDIVMKDLAIGAIEADGTKKVLSVETRYDKGANQYTSSASVPNPENFCEVTYLDEDNKENSMLITSFDSDITKLYDFEYALDYEDLSISDYEKMYNHINNIAENKKAKYSTFFDKYLSTKKLSKSEKEQKDNLENTSNSPDER